MTLSGHSQPLVCGCDTGCCFARLQQNGWGQGTESTSVHAMEGVNSKKSEDDNMAVGMAVAE